MMENDLEENRFGILDAVLLDADMTDVVEMVILS